MHRTQVGEVDSKVVLKGERFELKVSETGIDIDQAVGVAHTMTFSGGNGSLGSEIDTILNLVVMGPRTGNRVFSDSYADQIFTKIYEKCPSGRISGVTSIRETAFYPVVSGEVVRIIGYCYEG